MSTEALVLAVLSVIRPTTAAVVWAMLVGSRPRRLLTSYLLAGMAVSLTTGVAAVLFVGGLLSPRQVAAWRADALVVLGAAALVLALALALGWRGPQRSQRAADPRPHRRLSPAGAATAGVVTHLPGVFYLAALSAIVATGDAAGGAVLQVVVYNLVWFSPALVALGICLWGAVPAADRLDAPLAWGRAHQGPLLAAISGLVGVWLLIDGISDLA